MADVARVDVQQEIAPEIGEVVRRAGGCSLGARTRGVGQACYSGTRLLESLGGNACECDRGQEEVYA